MFKFLKEKLKNVVNRFSKKIDEEGKEEEIEEVVEEKTEKFEGIKSQFEETTEPQEIISEPKEEPKIIPELKEEKEIPPLPTLKKPEPIKEKIQKGEVPTLHELAKRKKEKTVSKKESVEIFKGSERPTEYKEEKSIIDNIQLERRKTKKIERPIKKETQKTSKERGFIQELDDEDEKTRPTADDILNEISNKPKKQDKDLTVDELIKESEKIVLPEDKILTAKELREKFKEERQAKREKIETETQKKETEKQKKETETQEGKTEKQIKETEKPEVHKEELKIRSKTEELIEPEAKGFFAKLKQKIVTKKINETQFDEIFWDLEIVLMENNVAIEVIEKIKRDLKNVLVDKPIKRGKIEQIILESLMNSVSGLFDIDKINLVQEIKLHKEKNNSPYVLCFLGINGSGKTTSIAKLVKMFQDNGIHSVIAAADTFRAAAIQQLEEHGSRLGVKVIKHDYGADAAAVAFDAIKYAEAHNLDVVLIDTAGRMHSNVNLMDELKKIIRVASPNLNIFVGESITGNDCVDQAKKFDEAVGINGIILTKADIDEKGGAALSVSYVTKRPILYLGVGQAYDELQEFDKDKVMKSLGFE